MQTDRRSWSASVSLGLQNPYIWILGVICVGVWMKTMMADQLQQISGIEQEQNWS